MLSGVGSSPVVSAAQSPLAQGGKYGGEVVCRRLS